MRETITKLIDDALLGLPLDKAIFKYLKMLVILVLVFYYIYPQALGIMGRSFIFSSGVIGIMLYAYNKFPFEEVYKLILSFLLLLFWFFIAEYINDVSESYISVYMNSQMGWFFSAYLIIYLLFNVHKKPSFEVIVGYIVAAVVLQCVLTFWISQDEEVKDFLHSLQLDTGEWDEEKIRAIEENRLMGYGTALFGAGMVAGYALIFIAYLIAKVNLTKIQFIALSIAYSFVFFIGLFSARTTIIGCAASIGFMAVLYFIDSSSSKKQPIVFAVASIVFLSIGAGIATEYYPEYTDWAYEMFDNYKATGRFSTESSDMLFNLLDIPGTIKGMLFGMTPRGMTFWGNDMGYSRLFYYCGFIGTILFFGYQFNIARLSMTKDLTANLLILVTVAYCMVMNVKGFTDLNSILYLFFFFFLFYKYYRFYPNLYLQLMVEKQEKLMAAKSKQEK